MTDMRWRPLLTASAEERALGAVQLVAQELEAATCMSRDDVDWMSERYPDAALFYGYFGRRFPDDRHAGSAAGFLDKAIDNLLAAAQPALGLYSGMCNVAWTVAHLQRMDMFEPGDSDQFEDIDGILAAALSSPWHGKYDLISGLVGIGVYLMEREDTPETRAILERLIVNLEEMSEGTPAGLRWLTPPEQLVEHQRKHAPRGYYNFGMAHGVPGIIALLGRVCHRLPGHTRARRLLDGAVNGLSSRKEASGEKGFYPAWEAVGQPEAPAGSRIAWCYGDLGLAVSLLLAARAVDNADWEREALAIAANCAARLGEHDGIVDAGICHGSAGNMHLFNRIYQATGRDAFARAALDCFERTLAFWKPGEPVAGFVSRRTPKDKLGMEPFVQEDLPDASFLMGAAGIGLALLAMATDKAPEWDAILLANISAR